MSASKKVDSFHLVFMRGARIQKEVDAEGWKGAREEIKSWFKSGESSTVMVELYSAVKKLSWFATFHSNGTQDVSIRFQNCKYSL